MKASLLLVAIAFQAPQDEEVEKLVAQLRAVGIEDRCKAESDLVALGEKIGPRIVRYLTDPDADVRMAIQNALVKIGSPAAVVDAVLAGDADLSLEAGAVFHRMHARHLPEDWERIVARFLSRQPRRATGFKELCEDLSNGNTPLLLWPGDTARPTTDRRYAGTYEEILSRIAGDEGWETRLSEGGILVYPKARADRARKMTLCQAMIASLSGEEAPSRLSVLFADLCNGRLDRALVERVGSSEGFWRHARDILIYRGAKQGVEAQATREVLKGMEERLLHEAWPVRAIAAQALVQIGHLPADKLLHEDPCVRYLAATVAERTHAHSVSLNTLMRDRYRDIRTRALFATVFAREPSEVDFDAVLYATDSVAEPDREKSIERLREMRAVEPLGRAVVKALGSDSKDLAFRLADVFRQPGIMEGVCRAARGESQERYQEKYLPLLEGYMNEEVKETAQEALFAYVALPSERIGGAAAAILVRRDAASVPEGFKSLLSHDLVSTRRRAVESLYGWARNHCREFDARSDAWAEVLEACAKGESDKEVASLARHHASALRVRGTRPPLDQEMGGGGRFGARLGGKRNLVARGGGGADTEGPSGWRPEVEITIPRPDFGVQR